MQKVLAGEVDGLGDKYAQIVQTTDGFVFYTAGPVKAGDQTVGVVLVGTAALKDFKSGTGHGTISILSDSFGGSSTPFAQVGFAMAGQLTFTLGTHLMNVNYTIPAGHSLEITLIVPNSSQEDLWIAYDTLAYRSRIVMP